jgi:chemotaxis protein MotB
MKFKVILPLFLLMFLSACQTPWYKLEIENEELRAENERLINSQSNIDKKIYSSEQARLTAEKRFEELNAKQNQTINDLRSKLKGTGLTVKIVNGRPVIVLPNGVLFRSGQHKLLTSGQKALKTVSSILNSKYSKFVISVEGHTDSDPISKSKYKDNYQLSAERAREVLNYLSKSGGIKSERLQGAFYGPSKPVSSNKTSAGKRKNRRVEIVLIG